MTNIPDPGTNELSNIVVLTDENGMDVSFEFLDCVTYRDAEYIILLPVGATDGMVVILRVEGEGDNETYEVPDSEEEARAVFEAFKKKAADDFTFL